jgi:4-hydroxyacetophenone monooxygenase
MKSEAARASVTSEAPTAARTELKGASDAEIDEPVRFADPMALRGLIYQSTGDESLVETAVVKSRVFFADAYAPATPEDVALIQAKAAAFLKSYRDGGAGPIGLGPLERLPKSLALSAGEPIAADELACGSKRPLWIPG